MLCGVFLNKLAKVCIFIKYVYSLFGLKIKKFLQTVLVKKCNSIFSNFFFFSKDSSAEVKKNGKKGKGKQKIDNDFSINERRPSFYDPNRARRMKLLGDDELLDFGRLIITDFDFE